jgi:hypothetical protein
MREEKTLDDDFELSLSFSLSLAFEARTFNRATLLCGRTNTALVFSRLSEYTTKRSTDDFRVRSCVLLVFFEKTIV